MIPWETLNTIGKCKISPFSVKVKQTLCPNICLNYSFEAGSGNQIGGWSYIERSERSCIRNRSGVGRAERGLVSRKNGGRSGRARFERGCIRDTARIQWVLIGDRYALQSERVIFYPIITDHAIKIARHWSGLVGCLVWMWLLRPLRDWQFPPIAEVATRCQIGSRRGCREVGDWSGPRCDQIRRS